MKRIRTICFAMVLFASLSGFALTEIINGVTWTYSVVNGGARISGGSPTSGTLTIPSKLGGYDVTSIGDESFRNCSGLTGVSIPSSVTSIGTSAFRDSGLTSVTIGNGVRTIGNSAFYGCSGLTDVTIPNNVTTIENFAFYDCDGLKEVKIPNSVTFIGPSAFASCDGLVSVTLGNGMARIGSYAFRYCSQLVAVRFEGNCPATIGDNVFTGVASDCCVYVTRNSMGWGVTIPGTWKGLSIGWAQYIVRFNANGGTCATSEVSVERDTAIEELPVPTWDNATFIGWFTETEGGTRLEESTVITDDVTLYAHWELHSNVWLYDLKNGEATITKYSSPEGDVLIPEEIDGYSVAAIGTKVFSGCTNLTSITIPDNVKDIGNYAFEDCIGLTSVTIGNGVTNVGNYAFKNCSSLMSVMLGNDVKSIGYSAFNGCTNLTSVTIPDSVTSIGYSAFDGCSNLVSVVVGDGVTSVGPDAFRGTPFYNNLPDGLVVLGKVAYEMRGTCPSVVTIPDGVVIIGNSVFSGCSGMTSVTISDGVTIIGSSAFSRCSGLTSVTIPDSVTSIGSSAFHNCSGLTNVTIGSGVTNVGSSAFFGCRGLTSMTISDGVASIGSYAFRDCVGLTNVTIPDSVTIIGEAAFSGCTNLTSMTLPFVGSMRGNNGTSDSLFGYIFGTRSSWYPRNAFFPTPQYYSDFGGNGCVSNCIPASLRTVIITDETNIGYGAFSNCTNLTCVTLSQSITNIGAYAFYGSSSVWYRRIYQGLTNITIPGNVERIGEYAFANCNGLTNVVFYGDAPQVEYNTFSYVPSVCQGYVRRLSSGWGVKVPGRWNGIEIDYFDIYHDVTLDPNGGECTVDKVSVAEGMEIGPLEVPTREHATFLGWFTSAYGGEEASPSFMGTDDITLYACWLDEPVVASDSGLTFRTDSCEVSISCATDGATIYYTDDGSTPKRYDDYLYTGPVTITETTTFKAVAVVGGIRSAYVTVTITKKPLTMEEVLDVGEGVTVATSASLPWRPILDSNAKIGDATARSGVIGNRTNTWLSATVSGAGTMTFWCKVSCEHDEVNNLFICDRLMVYTNDVEITDWRMDGETGWTQRELTFEGGENTVKWVYYKDKSDSAGEDCAWVDGITWTPSGADARLAAWLAERNLTVDVQAANGRTAAECYALGLDPADATNDFRIVSIELVDGKPKVEWEPRTNRWTGAEIQAVLKGAAALDGEWKAVEGATAAEKAAMRFFKVVVVVP